MHSFEPFRVVGSICGEVPVSFTYLYGEPLLMVATGRTFQLYKGVSLRMVRGGPTYPNPIRAVAQSSKFRCVAEGPNIHVMVHHKPLWNTVLESITKPDVLQLLAQDELLFAVGANKYIMVYDLRTGNVLQEIRVDESESITALCLPSGYTNKLLVGTEEGSLQLYNYRNGTCLWKSKKSSNAPVLSLASSVYKDVVAFGTGDGKAVLFHLAEDEVITEFQHTNGAVTALAFRVDKDGFLVSGTSLGEIVVWDIENRAMDGLLTRGKEVRTESEVRDSPHTQAVHTLIVFPPPTTQVPASATAKTAPLLVSCSADNSLMQFRFDTVDGLGLMVRERRGHASSCTAASFFNSDLLLTAGTDQSLRATHIFSDRASWEMSQGRLGKRGRAAQQSRDSLKVPPATTIVSSTIRNYQWSSVVTLHECSAVTCGWRMDSRSQEFKLSGIKTTSHTARSIAISDCGNFVVVGYSSGHAVRMNIQNRSVRQLFDPSFGGLTDDEDSTTSRAHESAVECVEVGNENTTIVTAGLDGAIKFWSLLSGDWLRTLSTRIPITKSCLHAVSSLLLVVHHLRIDVYHSNPELDLTDDKMASPVRTMTGHTSAITAMAIAPDSYRYVVSTSADGMVLLWDIAAGACVGQYRFASPVVSLAFHPDALFLVTVHAGESGAFLWSNNLRYGFVPEVVLHPEQQNIENVPLLAYPKSHGATEERNQKDIHSANVDENDREEPETGEVTLYDVDKDLSRIQREKDKDTWERLNRISLEGIQLSRTVPRQTWFHLTVLDQIKEKNQPLLPPKKKNLPFFLATTPGARPTFLVVASSSAPEESGISRVSLGDWNPVQKLLLEKNYEAVMQELARSERHATPQSIDLELRRAVDYIEGAEYEPEEIERMQACLNSLLECVLYWLRKGEEADLIQGILSNLLRTHAALIGRFGDVFLPVLEAIAEAQNHIRYTMDHLVSFPSCIAGTLSGSIF